MLNEAVKNYPEKVSLKLSLANSYLNEGNDLNRQQEKSELAQEILFKLEEEGYEYVYLYDLIAYSYEIVNNFEKDIEYYNKGLNLNPNSSNSIFGKGHCLDLLGLNEDAFDLYKKEEASITEETENSVKMKIYLGMGRMSYITSFD